MASNRGHFAGIWEDINARPRMQLKREIAAIFGMIGLITPGPSALSRPVEVHVINNPATMELPECDRPESSQRFNRHAARHYIENPGPIGIDGVSFFSYSFLYPPDANTHGIKNSVCNTDKKNPLNFKWEPVGLSHVGLPPGECWCIPLPLGLKHAEVKVLDLTSTMCRELPAYSLLIQRVRIGGCGGIC